MFSKNLPVPSIEVFEGGPIPPFIQQRAEASTKAVLKFLESRAVSSVEPAVIRLQRSFRAKRRQKEERVRVSKYETIDGETEIERKAGAEEALREANTPYRPKKCSPELADRIVKAAEKVKLFSTVHHLTSERALENIFNGSLAGRRNLLQSYLPFKPAALRSADLAEGGGDANVICFGPSDIDPKAIQEDSIDLVFDLDKLGTNPCIFYKQRDLGYGVDKQREMRIGKGQSLLFSHTSDLRKPERGHTNLQIFTGKYGGSVAYSELPNYLFIAYDVPHMHQILALNFFRFLDTLCGLDYSSQKTRIDSIYADIEKLDDKELLEFLTDLGQKMTDTAEFNFYGAYQIDFSALQTIYSKKSDYKLVLPEFIKELQSGNQKKLKEAVAEIPTIFKSHRFLDYLLSKVENDAVRKDLLELRRAAFAKAPTWMREQHKASVKDAPDLGKLDKQLLEKLEKISSLSSSPDLKEEMETEILAIKAIQEKASFALDHKLSNGKTVKEQIEADVPRDYRKNVLEIFSKPSLSPQR